MTPSNAAPQRKRKSWKCPDHLPDALRPSGEDIMKAQRTLIAVLIALASVPALAAAKFDVYTQGAAQVSQRFDVYSEGAKAGSKFDPYTEGALARAGKFDTYTEGAKAGSKFDPYTEGAVA